MFSKRISIEEAVKFHGHLGPYLVLGVLAGELALKKLRCKKYFGLTVKVYGAEKKPKSCFIDGLQLSTGATFGKGNILKAKAKGVSAVFSDSGNNRKLRIGFKEDLRKQLEGLKGHRDSEAFARKLYLSDGAKFFNLSTGE